ncbi:MAG: hypothetical protein AAGH15_02110 [Myxococcota bacterium]
MASVFRVVGSFEGYVRCATPRPRFTRTTVSPDADRQARDLFFAALPER